MSDILLFFVFHKAQIDHRFYSWIMEVSKFYVPAGVCLLTPFRQVQLVKRRIVAINSSERRLLER